MDDAFRPWVAAVRSAPRAQDICVKAYRSDILICMRESTTVRLSKSTRDNLRHLADDDGVTLDDEIIRLVRAERQRRIGQALSESEPDTEEQLWLGIGAETVRNNAGR